MRKFTWAICSRCDGHGTIVNPSVDGNGLTQEDFDEDPDFREAYFGGVYDIACPDCESGKVRVPNMAALTFSEKRELVRKRQSERFHAEWAREREREYRMCGGR